MGRMKELIKLLPKCKDNLKLMNLMLGLINSKLENEFSESLKKISDDDLIDLVEILKSNGYTTQGIKDILQ